MYYFSPLKDEPGALRSFLLLTSLIFQILMMNLIFRISSKTERSKKPMKRGSLIHYSLKLSMNHRRANHTYGAESLKRAYIVYEGWEGKVVQGVAYLMFMWSISQYINQIISMFHATQHEVTIDLSSIGGALEPSLEVDALVILNSDVSHMLLDYFVFNSHHIILCDGAANHLYRSKHRNAPNIRAIVGDLDSIEPEVKTFYQKKNVEVRDLSADQDTNDFEKGLTMAAELECKRVVCLGLLGGRFDQEMCNLSTLQKYAMKNKEANYVAAGKYGLICVIKPHLKAIVKIGKSFAKKYVGLTSFGKAKVQTEGLKWELGHGQGGPNLLQWGVLVSSSNEIVNGEVSIITSQPIFLSLELQNAHKELQNNITQLL